MSPNINKTKKQIEQKLKSDLIEDFDRNILKLILRGLNSIEKNGFVATQSLLEFGVLAKYEINLEENEK